jgi:hypothetical protein
LREPGAGWGIETGQAINQTAGKYEVTDPENILWELINEHKQVYSEGKSSEQTEYNY